MRAREFALHYAAMRHLKAAALALPLTFIIGIVVAIVTWPWWDWFEEKTGIESMGHSGPANWVFVFCWIVCFVPLFAYFFSLFAPKR